MRVRWDEEGDRYYWEKSDRLVLGRENGAIATIGKIREQSVGLYPCNGG
ncbi:MAG: hypothetical protein F6K30_31235 [Cyanothece sp. SIO2G6]|nr:hypothetical protein [Cyanothece sp. SIO2G6]